MTTPAPSGPAKRSKRIYVLWGIGVVLATVVTAVGISVHRWANHIGAAYEAERAILSLEGYVRAHNGDWPRSWSDIGGPPPARANVVVRFDLKSADLLKDPDLIFSAVRPGDGHDFAYRRARSDLERIVEAIAEAKSAEERK